jgi:hypothetical protein
MKYRIIERGDGKFIVEKEKIIKKFFKDEIYWEHVSTQCEDYPEVRSIEDRMDNYNSVFSTLDLAQKKMRRLIECTKLKELRKTFKIIEECEV